MVKKTKVFKPGDYVFAKVKGYPAWPAKVNNLNGKKYSIYFFGTGETGNIPANDMFDYFLHKQQFLSKAIKRRDYNEGIAQIEEELTSLGVTSNAEGSGDVSKNDADTTVEESSTVADNSTTNDTTADESAATAANDKSIGEEDDKTDGTMDVDEPTLPQTGDIVESEQPSPVKEIAKSTPEAAKKSPKTPKTVKSPKKAANPEPVAEKGDSLPDSTISRSGRKIKPKRYLDEEKEEGPSVKRSKIESQPKETENGKKEVKPQEDNSEKKKKKTVQNGNVECFNFISAGDLEDGSASKSIEGNMFF